VWQTQPIAIDGDSKDWPSPYPNYDAKAKIAYATSNDKDFLYITMETGDEMTQMKILKQGMTVSIDTGGGRAASFNISYPLQGDIDLADLPRGEGGKNKDNMHYEDKQREQRLAVYAKEANQFATDGFINCNGAYVVKQATPCGISVRLGLDEYKQLVWEAAIPFKAIYNKPVISAADAGKTVSVCFAIKGFKKPDNKNSDDHGGMNNGAGATGSNSQMRGGGRGGGRPSIRQTDNPMDHLYESTKTWKTFGITWQQ